MDSHREARHTAGVLLLRLSENGWETQIQVQLKLSLLPKMLDQFYTYGTKGSWTCSQGRGWNRTDMFECEIYFIGFLYYPILLGLSFYKFKLLKPETTINQVINHQLAPVYSNSWYYVTTTSTNSPSCKIKAKWPPADQ